MVTLIIRYLNSWDYRALKFEPDMEYFGAIPDRDDRSYFSNMFKQVFIDFVDNSFPGEDLKNLRALEFDESDVLFENIRPNGRTKYLDISGNRIKRISPQLSRFFSEIYRLNISNNQLECLDEELLKL